MRVLAAKGLVDIRQKIGTRVRRTDQWNAFDVDILRWHSDEGRGESIFKDLVEVRQIMEPQAALAAGRASMDDLRRLETALRTMDASVGDRDAYAHADVDFHVAVYGASHNALLRQFGAVVADSMYLSFSVQQVTATNEARLVRRRRPACERAGGDQPRRRRTSGERDAGGGARWKVRPHRGARTPRGRRRRLRTRR